MSFNETWAFAGGSDPTPLTLTVHKGGTGTGSVTSSPPGIECGSDCSEAYSTGTVISLTATPDAGSTFKGWGGHANCADGVVTLTASLTCSATFDAAQTVTLQAVNAGGGGYTDLAGNTWAPDQAFTSGGWGYVGSSSTRSTLLSIASTEDDPLFKTQRRGMQEYRFTLATGTYRVELGFAELERSRAGDRIFSVTLEGQTVLTGYDIYATVGRFRADWHTFTVTVTDGILNIDFIRSRGDPVINAIRITSQPP